ncbi:MaoC/PaaZ C-terminal domain-containing protein [Thermodesulforhabdus norvegica]|uniref:Acyl dehydratase n=1 Tax=Thermodesulforhabdus norvegica TaxID=39841 RepID=A0A1I4T5R2_9BACT|nr:MaoC/PaaZ C-terminal domain-containing protein [Thermodesulforhabdus norvegica]SFM72074.1 Acyl dehydratase [Thermodesulforhabdus norvegica]
MINLEIVGQTFGPFDFVYDWRDAVLYNLSVGAGISELEYLYERVPGGLRVYPSFVTVTGYSPLYDILEKLGIDISVVLHGEQSLRVFSPVPAEGIIKSYARVSGVYDKKKAALVVLDVYGEMGSAERLFEMSMGLFCRGFGGWGGDPGPRKEAVPLPEKKEPDFSLRRATLEEQAALYRLCGDYNPLHIDPECARQAGFSRPILHGLCTFGHVVRALVLSLCKGDPSGFRSLECRFSNVVYPGDVINVDGWRLSGGRYALRVWVDRGDGAGVDVLSRVVAEIAE